MLPIWPWFLIRLCNKKLFPFLSFSKCENELFHLFYFNKQGAKKWRETIQDIEIITDPIIKESKGHLVKKTLDLAIGQKKRIVVIFSQNVLILNKTRPDRDPLRPWIPCQISWQLSGPPLYHMKNDPLRDHLIQLK